MNLVSFFVFVELFEVDDDSVFVLESELLKFCSFFSRIGYCY